MTITSGPARDCKNVTPNDTAIVGASALYVGVSGDVTIDTADHTDVLYKAHPVGYLPSFTLRLKTTGTTATNFVALY